MEHSHNTHETNNILKKIPRWAYILVVAIIIVWSLVGWVVNNYNDLVALDEGVNKSFSDIEIQYQRRVDLIPNIVSITNAAAITESDVLIGVTEARTKYLGFSGSTANISEKMAAMGSFDSALARLMVVVEKYPDLKSIAGFESLKAEWEGTENRIAVSRRDYNAYVTQYNIRIKQIPGRFFASMFGFEEKVLFETLTEGAEKAIEVKFKDIDLPVNKPRE